MIGSDLGRLGTILGVLRWTPGGVRRRKYNEDEEAGSQPWTPPDLPPLDPSRGRGGRLGEFLRAPRRWQPNSLAC